MKDYLPLKVEFCLYENVLCGKIIQQDDRLIKKVDKDGVLIKKDNTLYRICIVYGPDLSDYTLFLRGLGVEANNNMFFYDYDNKHEAETALKNFKELITQVNNLYADRGGIIDKANTGLEVCE